MHDPGRRRRRVFRNPGLRVPGDGFSVARAAILVFLVLVFPADAEKNPEHLGM